MIRAQSCMSPSGAYLFGGGPVQALRPLPGETSDGVESGGYEFLE
jgi:hypothetical protein